MSKHLQFPLYIAIKNPNELSKYYNLEKFPEVFKVKYYEEVDINAWVFGNYGEHMNWYKADGLEVAIAVRLGKVEEINLTK